MIRETKDNKVTSIVLVALLITSVFAFPTLRPAYAEQINIYPETSGTVLSRDGTLEVITWSVTSNFFDRGFIEFSIPVFERQVQQATLILKETRGTTSFPLPSVFHELSYYQADLVIDTSDYNRPTTPIASFETDENEPHRVFSFDITSLINQFQGSNLGFRITVPENPFVDQFPLLGSSFQFAVMVQQTDPDTPIINIFRDFTNFAATGTLTEIDFENLPPFGSSNPDPFFFFEKFIPTL